MTTNDKPRPLTEAQAVALAAWELACSRSDATFARFMADPSPGRLGAATRAARLAEEREADWDFS